MKNVVRAAVCLPLSTIAYSQPPQSTNRLTSTQYKPISKLLSDQPDDCNALLKDGVFDKENKFGSSFQVAVFLNRFCSAEYTSYGQASSDGANLGVPIGDLMASFGFSDFQQNFSTDYKTLCDQKDSYAQSNQVNSTIISKVDAKLAEAFVACVASKPFAAYLQPTDINNFQIFIDYHPKGEGDCKVTDFTYDRSIVKCDNPPRAGWFFPTKIGPEGLVIQCSRNSEKSVVQIALNTTQGKEGFRIPAYVPPPPPLPSGNALFDNLPIGTILALSTLPTPLPHGWFLCDGQNGTVDLIGRMPLGSNPGEVVTGPQPGARGTETAQTTSANETSIKIVGGWAASYPAGNGHTHPLPVQHVYFIQKVAAR
jgi:hypothetical protein